MRWLGGSLLVFAALIWLGACARDTPASDTVPEQEEQEPLYASDRKDRHATKPPRRRYTVESAAVLRTGSPTPSSARFSSVWRAKPTPASLK